jgi:hypothetical protein
MTPTERTRLIVFALGMLVASGLSIKAVVSGVHDLPPRDPKRTRKHLAPVLLILLCLAIFPWSTVF